MNFSDQSTLQTQNAAFYSTIYGHTAVINHFSSSSERASETKGRSKRDAALREFFAKFAVHSASFDAAERGDPPKCHPETRIAVQDSLVAWRSNREAGPVRLISGWAGTGKTTIAQTMAEYWAKRGQLAGSFFFSRSSKERREIVYVLETILHQFLQIFGVDVDAGNIAGWRTWDVLLKSLNVIMSASPSLLQPLVIVIDGLDECQDTYAQVSLLRNILESLGQLGSSFKFLISCRPERHIEEIFDEFASKLGPSYRIYLGQSEGDKSDIRTYFRVSFDRICLHRRKDGAMSITSGPWPSQEEVEWLVDRASGQFVFAATLIWFVDDENEDPVEMLNLVLEQRTSSFEAIDLLYLVILKRVGMTLDKSEKSLELRQLMQNLILHVNSEPSSSADIAEFWFEREVTVNILVKHLQALLVRPTDTDSQDSQVSQNLIQFRHKSFHDFFVRPSASHDSHPFSLAETNPVSKFFFSLRTRARKAVYNPGRWGLQPSQWLGYTFLYCNDHMPADFPYDEEARRLHQSCVHNRATFRGCTCLPRLYHIMSDFSALRTFKPCGQGDCIIDLDLLTLCRIMAIPIDHFTREWDKRERSRTFSFLFLKFLLWLRVMLYSLLSDPSTTFYGTIRALMSGSSSLNWQARCIAVVNGLLCVAVLVNTRWDVALLLYLSHTTASFLLRRFLRFDGIRIEPAESSLDV